MSDPDPHLTRWAMDQRAERQATSSHESYVIGIGPEGPMPGAGGITLRSSDLTVGERELELDVRPVLLGQVELYLRLTTKAPDASRSSTRRTYLYASPTAMRELAQQLLETADAAEKFRLKPKPVD